MNSEPWDGKVAFASTYVRAKVSTSGLSAHSFNIGMVLR